MRGPRRAADTDWGSIDRLYQTLEVIQPSPVVTLNRAVAVSKSRGPAAALALVEPLADRLDGYFYFHGVRGGLLMQLGDAGRRPARPSTGPSRWPARRPRRPISALHIDRLGTYRSCRPRQPRLSNRQCSILAKIGQGQYCAPVVS